MLPPSSLIIPSRNRSRLLTETVQSVLHGDAVPSELVIVDQSDADAPLELPLDDARCEIRHVRTRSVGLSRARNEGIRTARHDLLVFLDDDMLVVPGWFEIMTRTLIAAGRRTVVTGAVHAGACDVPSGFTPATVTRPHSEIFQGRIGTDVLAGGNMALWRAALDEVGLFDDRLGAGSRWSSAEDNDLGYRLLEAGHRIHYVPEALVYHRAWRPSKEYLRVRWNYGLGKGGFYVKHASIRAPHTVKRAWSDIGGRIIKLPGRLFRARRRALGDVVYSAGILWGAAQWLLMQNGWAIARRTRSTPR